jgi:uncharacterized protein involved in exopolysaccharide biosynthesis
MDKDNPLYYWLSWLYSRRRFLIVHTILVCIIAVAIALSLRKTYTSSATILPPETSELSSFLAGDLSGGIGGVPGALSGGSNTATRKLLSILNSRSLAERTITRFNLEGRYEGANIEDRIDRLHSNTMFTIDDDNMLSIRVRAHTDLFHPDEEENEARHLAYQMCSFISHALDSTYTQLQVEQARQQRKLIQRRLEQNREDLQQAQLDLKTFAEQNSAIALPEQIESSVSAAAEIQSQLLINKLELSALQATYSDDNTTIRQKQTLVKELSKALGDFRTKGLLKDSLSVLPSFNESPELVYEYAQIQMDLKVQEELHKYLTQQFERAKLEEAKQAPVLQFIDTPRVPTRKSGPPRTIITIILVFLGVLAGLIYLVITDIYWDRVRDTYREIAAEQE